MNSTDRAGPQETEAPNRIVAALIVAARRHSGLGPLALARRHKLVGPVAVSIIADAGASEALRAEAVSLLDQCRHRAGRVVGELISVTDAMREAGIRVLALKGVALGRLLYGDPALRAGLDMDLLIAARDLDRAITALQAIGYLARPRADGLAREIHLINQRRNFVVDLHWNVVGSEIPFALEFDVVWAARRSVELAGSRIELPSIPWLVVLASLYLVKEFPWVDLIYLADLEQLAGQMTDGDRVEVARLAAATGTQRIVATALALLRRHGVDAPAPVAGDAGVERLADQVERALTDPRHGRRRRYWHRLSGLLIHARFRERLVHRVWLWSLLPAFLILPDMEDITRAEQAGSSPWTARLRRVPEVLAALTPVPQDPVSRVAAALADPHARIRPTPGVELFLLDDAGLLLDPGAGELSALSTTACWRAVVVCSGLSPGPAPAAASGCTCAWSRSAGR